ncbi:hypothetical protein A6J71_00135 [Enterobacter cancerogenus]|uniref:hypothetical protein n=1 Tax=Enterobacter cancerogenus TaxID=69218 RepID=UPI000C9C9310|nr:hypothetical protein [Enterobacter cancerogenus]PNF13484.1 hypothetical protein A6J71_00135 [Enterobacter cancerogenus]
MPYQYHPYRCLAVALIALLLAGCAGSRAPEIAPQVYAGAGDGKDDDTPGTDLRLCEQELAAMQKLAPEKYALRQAEFDQLMGAASGYSGVRDTVGQKARLTADAFYEYKTSVVCARIRQDTLEALITLPGA